MLNLRVDAKDQSATRTLGHVPECGLMLTHHAEK